MSAIPTDATPPSDAGNLVKSRSLSEKLSGFVAVNVVQALIGLCAIYTFTRLLGADGYGHYTLILTAVNFLFIIGYGWIEAAARRFYAPMAAQGRTADLIKSLSWLLMAVTPLVILGSISIFALTPMAPPAQLAAGLAIAYLVLRGWVRLGAEMHRAAGRIATFGALEITQIVLGFAIGAGLAAFTQLAEAAPIAGMLLAVLIALAVNWPKQAKAAKSGKVDHKSAKTFAVFGWSIAMIIVVEQALAFADRFFIADILGAAEAGAFAAASGLAPRLLDILFIGIARATAPFNASVYQSESSADAGAALKHYFTNLIALTLPVAVIIILSAAPLAKTMVAPDMALHVEQLIPWLTISGLLAGFTTYYFGESYRLGRKMRLCSLLLSISCLINIGLNIALLPRLGLLGGAIASVSGFGFAVLTLAIFTKRAVPLPISAAEIAKAAAATALMGVCVFLLPRLGGISEIAQKVVCGGIIYAVAAVLINVGGARSLAGRLIPGSLRPPMNSAAPEQATHNDGTKTDGTA